MLVESVRTSAGTIEWIGALLLAALFTFLAVASAERKSLTKDEYAYLGAAVVHEWHADYSLTPEHPPFSKRVSGWFLRTLELTVPDVPESGHKRAKYAFAHTFLLDNAERERAIAMRARLPHILIGTMLGLAVWFACRTRFGAAGASVALALFATDPNVLAHARLLQTDTDSAALYFTSVCVFLACLRGAGGWTGALLFACLLALALLTKFSTLILLPVLALLFALLMRSGSIRARGGLPLLLASAIVVPALALLLYQGDPGPFFEGASRVWSHNEKGHAAYLLGEWSERGWWYYFPVALAVKTPLPLLLLGVCGIVRILTDRLRGKTPAGGCLLLAGAAWFAAAMTSSLNLGIRHVLPAYVFLFVAAAREAAQWWRAGTLPRVALAGLLVWQAVSAVKTHPDYIPYFNEAAGGPGKGQRYLTGSNLSWGQDAIALRDWMHEEEVEEVVLRALGIPLPQVYGVRTVPANGVRPTPSTPVWFAIDATMRARLLRAHEPDRNAALAFLEAAERVAVLGGSLAVYRVTSDFPAALGGRARDARTDRGGDP